MIRGYTSGVFDLFHVGHLRLLKNCKKHCDYLIVGVCSDKLVLDLKGRKPVIPLEQRVEIVSVLPFVDKVIVKTSDNDSWIAYKCKAKILFKGSDWKNKKKWKFNVANASALNIKTMLLPRTPNVSSTRIRGRLK